MPSETFFRLPESKQERIIEAIKEEISRVPFENFSINNVIHQCGIISIFIIKRTSICT